MSKCLKNLNSCDTVVHENGNKNILAYRTKGLVTFIAQYKGQQVFSIKGQIVNVFKFVSRSLLTYWTLLCSVNTVMNGPAIVSQNAIVLLIPGLMGT